VVTNTGAGGGIAGDAGGTENGVAGHGGNNGGVGGVFYGGGDGSIPAVGNGIQAYGGGNPGDGSVGGDGIDAYAGSGIGIYALNGGVPGTLAALLNGDVQVTGNLSKAGGSFQIDHPLDPANKYLYHSFVESPDMKNIYDGNVTTDAAGNATVTLPDWFETLNRDFRYQLTTIGQLCQATVASEIYHNSFAIKTDRPYVKVSWQVTGVRQDAWANAHRIPLEVEKDKADQGHYLHPELFGHADEPGIAQMHHPLPQRPERSGGGQQ